MANQTVLESVPAKIPRVAVYLSEEVKLKLEKLASVERRSLSQTAVLLIEQGLKKAEEEGKI